MKLVYQSAVATLMLCNKQPQTSQWPRTYWFLTHASKVWLGSSRLALTGISSRSTPHISRPPWSSSCSRQKAVTCANIPWAEANHMVKPESWVGGMPFLAMKPWRRCEHITLPQGNRELNPTIQYSAADGGGVRRWTQWTCWEKLPS